MRVLLIFVFVVFSSILTSDIYGYHAGTNILTIPQYKVGPSDTIGVEVELYNQDSVFGFQFDILFDSLVIFLDTCWLSERSVDHQLISEIIEPCRVRFICYSMTQSAFRDTIGVILTMLFVSPASIGEYDIKFDNPILVGANSVNILTGYHNGSIVVISGINEQFHIYNMYANTVIINNIVFNVCTSCTGRLELMLYNALGQCILRKAIFIDMPGEYKFTHYMGSYRSGTYYLVVKFFHNVQIFKMILLK